MKRTFAVILGLMILCSCAFGFTVHADEEENTTVTALLEQLEDLQELKKNKDEKYTVNKEIDLDLKIMLQYMGDTKKIGAEQYLKYATQLVDMNGPIKAKVGSEMNELNSNFKVWQATPTTAVYEGIQKDVTQILYIINSDKDEIAGTDTFKIILIVVILALAIGLFMKGFVMRRR